MRNNSICILKITADIHASFQEDKQYVIPSDRRWKRL